MASPAAPTEFSQETARQSLIAISQCTPETGSPLSPEVKPLNAAAANGYHDDGAEKCRSKLISISYLSSPDAQPTPCPPKNAAT